MSTTKKLIISSFILLVCLVIFDILLKNKYVFIGECAAITCYKPLTMWDRIVFVAIGIIGLLITMKLTTPKREVSILLSGLYTALVVAFSIFGNHLLEMPIEHWPHKYYPQPIDKATEINYCDKDLLGCWERTCYEASTDSVTFFSPLIEFMDDNMFDNGDTLFYYTYYLHHDTLTIHRPNNALQKYKVLGLTRDDFTVKLHSHEIFIDGPSDISDSITLHYKRLPNTYVAQKALPNNSL